MLKIAMISPLPPERAGEAPYTSNLIKSLVSNFNIEIIALGGPLAHELLPGNSKVKTYPVWKGKEISTIPEIIGIIKKEKPHLVHCQFGPHGKVYGGLFGEYTLTLLRIIKLSGIKTTITLHSTWLGSQVRDRISKYQSMGFLYRVSPYIFKIYMEFLDASTDSIQISTSGLDSSLKKKFLEEYTISPSKIFEIPHPCASMNVRTNLEPDARYKRFQERDILLFFGFIRKDKGLEVAIDAMRYLVDHERKPVLLIAGSPQGKSGKEYVKELKERVKSRGVDNYVYFDTRYISEKEIPFLFSISKALILPYSESVGASGPIHNYAIYGVPIIASNVGFHMEDALGGGVVLFENGNARDLAIKIGSILSNRSFSSRISQHNMEYAKTETWKLAAIRTMRYYRRTLEK